MMGAGMSLDATITVATRAAPPFALPCASDGGDDRAEPSKPPLDRFGQKKAKNQINVLDCPIWTGRQPLPGGAIGCKIRLPPRPLRACKNINRKKNGSRVRNRDR
jgi:hypothetical protein